VTNHDSMEREALLQEGGCRHPQNGGEVRPEEVRGGGVLPPAHISHDQKRSRGKVPGLTENHKEVDKEVPQR